MQKENIADFNDAMNDLIIKTMDFDALDHQICVLEWSLKRGDLTKEKCDEEIPMIQKKLQTCMIYCHCKNTPCLKADMKLSSQTAK